MYNIREGYGVYFPNCVENVRVQALSDSFNLLDGWGRTFWTFEL